MLHLCATAFLALAMAAAAHAEPKVGDQATYLEKLSNNGKTSSFQSVVQLVQFDNATHRYLERDTKQISGRPDQVVETWKETVELFTDEKIESILGDCDGAGGEGTLVWVPAGIYSACVLPVKADDMQPYSGKIWIARVPFGMAHAELHGPEGDSVINLSAYSRP